jgi:ABC-type transport system involved in cytochrome bd biosynthesis fused ATPase/permease subunit
MNNLYEYYDFLLKNYNLKEIHSEYVRYLYTFYIIRESFFWIILLTQQSELQDKNKLLKIIYFVFFLLMLSVILENFYLKIKTKLLVSLNKAHLEYSFNLINKCKENEILKLNFVEQFIYIDNIKIGLDNIVEENKIKTVIMVYTITLLLASRKINIFLVGILLFISNFLIKQITDKNLDKEDKLTEDTILNINSIRNYFISSKQKIINNQFNMNFCFEMFDKYIQNKMELVKIENNINTYNSISVFIITLIIVFYKYRSSTIFDIVIYLFIVYDLDYFMDNIFELHKIRKSFSKYNQNLKLFLKNKDLLKDSINQNKTIDSFEILSLKNNNPPIKLIKSIVLEKGDNILSEGISGQGKTTFLKFLKNIEKPDELKIKFCNEEYSDFKLLSDKIYFTIQNNKIFYNEDLYNYISNENPNPNLDRIKLLLKIVKIDHIYNGNQNEIIEVNKLSGGEIARLSLSQTLYDILEKNSDVILFDEIDVNLDTQTGLDIIQNIIQLFKNKIMFFIVHNEDLKTLFQKRILFQNGSIIPNF